MVASRGACVACMAGSSSVSRFVVISRTDLIISLSPVAGVVVARAIGALGQIAAVVSGGVFGIIASIPRVLPIIFPIVSLVAGYQLLTTVNNLTTLSKISDTILLK